MSVQRAPETAWLIPYSPSTWSFQQKQMTLIGTSKRTSEMASVAQEGDDVFAYVTEAVVIAGLFRISGSRFRDNTPLYFPSGRDPYDIRFPVRALWSTERLDEAVPLRTLVGDLELFAKVRESNNLGGVLRNLPQRISVHDSAILRNAVMRVSDSNSPGGAR